MHYRECMIESGRNVLIVFLISRNRVNKLYYVEVYQLNTDDYTWVNKENFGDMTVFCIVNCCMEVSAKRVGCRRNCIYCSISSGNGCWIYDMETATILPVETAISSTEFYIGLNQNYKDDMSILLCMFTEIVTCF
ncbi:hypothetical protein M5689_000557 [Euphorbia peplus]|nr:hypothetical protein M5689_000557 [Euphorbia peplus]